MEKESKYVKLQKIGQGAYGAVYKALNSLTNQTVALKISKFQDCDQGVPSTCLRQVSILKNLSHPNLVRLVDAEIFRGSNPRLEMAFQYIDYDLSKYIKIKSLGGNKGLTQSEAKKIIKSILQGIHYLHIKSILHRDLKPHNILITKQGNVKIADFGLGRLASYPLETMSKQIETLWYRSPQLLLGTKNYHQGVDVWSIGCIFYELVEGSALFQAQSEVGQLFEIFKVLGTPKKTQWPEIIDLPDFKVTFPKFIPSPLYFFKLSFQGQQWMWKLLKANPNQRLSVKSALLDKYLENQK